MLLSYLTLFIALCLSAVAAFYSIAGLTAIFAAAVIPIIIMGSILEVAKIVTTLWLHEYWRQAKLSLKMYLVPAVAVLMVLTSMGIFGFLSKAHLDQTVPVGDVVSQVALFDEKIKNERDTIDNARTLLGQLDKAVADISAGGDREITLRGGVKQTQSAAERALQVRRQQARDRAALTKTIEDAQARIVKLQEERAPIASQARKVEAEVGPIKYVAALIYGDNPDTNTLERAVRWVIILIVAVFDPLAIMLLLAATESLGWARASRQKKEAQNDIPASDPVDVADVTHNDRHADAVPQPLEPYVPPVVDPEPKEPEPDTPSEPIAGSMTPDESYKVEVQEIPSLPEDSTRSNDDDEFDNDDSSVVRQAKHLWKLDNPGLTLKEQRRLVGIGQLDREPWMDYLEDPRIQREPDFGDTLPTEGLKGDIFVLTSATPTQVYKFNGTKWIIVNKDLTDQYAYNDAYIDHLIAKIGQGNYDPDLLTEAERLQIAQRLRREV